MLPRKRKKSSHESPGPSTGHSSGLPKLKLAQYNAGLTRIPGSLPADTSRQGSSAAQRPSINNAPNHPHDRPPSMFTKGHWQAGIRRVIGVFSQLKETLLGKRPRSDPLDNSPFDPATVHSTQLSSGVTAPLTSTVPSDEPCLSEPSAKRARLSDPDDTVMLSLDTAQPRSLSTRPSLARSQFSRSLSMPESSPMFSHSQVTDNHILSQRRVGWPFELGPRLKPHDHDTTDNSELPSRLSNSESVQPVDPQCSPQDRSSSTTATLENICRPSESPFRTPELQLYHSHINTLNDVPESPLEAAPSRSDESGYLAPSDHSGLHNFCATQSPLDISDDILDHFLGPSSITSTAAVCPVSPSLPWDALSSAQQEEVRSLCQDAVDRCRMVDPEMEDLRKRNAHPFFRALGLNYTSDADDAFGIIMEHVDMMPLIRSFKDVFENANLEPTPAVAEQYYHLLHHKAWQNRTLATDTLTQSPLFPHEALPAPNPSKPLPKEEHHLIMGRLNHGLKVVFRPLFDELLRTKRQISLRFGLKNDADCVTTALLDDLHSPSAALTEQVRRIFVPQQNSIVGGSSGRGKTRTGIQGGAKIGSMNFGFVAGIGEPLQKTLPNGHEFSGAQDLHVAMTEVLPNMNDFGAIYDDPTQLEKNRNSLRHLFLALICGRLVIMEMFYDSKPRRVSLLKWHIEWAAFQALAILYQRILADSHEDIFVYFFRLFMKATIDTLEEIFYTTWKRIISKYPQFADCFALVFDNAHLGAEMYSSDHFHCRFSPDKPRPVLTELLTAAMELNTKIFTHTVFLGSSASTGMMKEALESAATSFGLKTVELSVDGSFGDQKAHQEFIRRKLQSRADECEISPDSFRWFLSRAVAWFPGRPMITMWLIEIILRTKTKSFHRVITYIVLRWSKGWKATDGGKYQSLEAALTAEAKQLTESLVAECSINWNEFDALHSDIKQSIYQVAMRQLFGFGTSLEGNVIKLIETNFAQVTYECSGVGGSGTVRFQEPIVLAALAANRRAELLKQMAYAGRWGHVPEMQGFSFELQVAVAAIDKLQGFIRLDELLTIDTKFKHLGKLEVEFVSVYLVDGKYVASRLSFKEGPFVQFAFKASTCQDMLDYIYTRTGAGFILPDNFFRIDLYCLVREKQTGALIPLLWQLKHSKGKDGKGEVLRKETWEEAVDSLNPDTHYGKKYDAKTGITTYRPKAGKEILEGLEKMCLAENTDYEPPAMSRRQRAAKMKQLPKMIQIIAVSGVKHATLSEEAPPIAVMKNDHLKVLFGNSWELSHEQTKSEPPLATLGSVASPN